MPFSVYSQFNNILNSKGRDILGSTLYHTTSIMCVSVSTFTSHLPNLLLDNKLRFRLGEQLVHICISLQILVEVVYWPNSRALRYTKNFKAHNTYISCNKLHNYLATIKAKGFRYF